MKKKYFITYLMFCISLVVIVIYSCSSPEIIEPPEDNDDPNIPAPPDDPKEELDEYTYIQVRYRKLENGLFQSWTTEESSHTRIIDNMNWYEPSADKPSTEWGGIIGLATNSIVGKEGYFRIANIDGRYYFLDPDNGAVILHGIQHVRPGESPEHKSAFSNKFGDILNWSEQTGSLIADNNFNYISYGSNRIEKFPESIYDNLLNPGTQKIGYAENLYLLRTFMWDMHKNLGYAFEDGKYNRLVLLFEPTFATYIDNLVEKKTKLFVNDRHFVGYYLDNELPFASYRNSDAVRGVDIKHFFSLPDRYKSARIFAEEFLKDKGITSVDNITEDDQEEFRGKVADYYYKITSETVRRHDPNHLILGNRLHDWSKYNQKVVEACAHYCDVVSINYYARWQPETHFISNLKAWCDTTPFLITEFYTKAENAKYKGQKYPNVEGGGWVVGTQKNRGEFYQNFCLRLLESEHCVGWIHFEYNDEYGTSLGASNKGVVSIEYTPYNEFLKYVKQMNSSVHSLIEYYNQR